MTLELIEGESLWNDEDPLTEVTWTDQDGEVVRSVDLINYGYLFSHELPEQDWAIPYLVPSGGQVVIYSKAGHGKPVLRWQPAVNSSESLDGTLSTFSTLTRR